MMAGGAVSEYGVLMQLCCEFSPLAGVAAPLIAGEAVPCGADRRCSPGPRCRGALSPVLCARSPG